MANKFGAAAILILPLIVAYAIEGVWLKSKGLIVLSMEPRLIAPLEHFDDPVGIGKGRRSNVDPRQIRYCLRYERFSQSIL